jgi:hypothetical protein
VRQRNDTQGLLDPREPGLFVELAGERLALQQQPPGVLPVSLA